MDFCDLKSMEEKYYAHTFTRLPVGVKSGQGMYLHALNGDRYLDMFAGIAVNSLGHSHPALVDAITLQAKTLLHTSNWIYTMPQVDLAKTLVELTGLSKAFITNDGSEAVECAIKLSRKVTGKKGIVAMENAFHGRTMGALSLTSGEKYRKPFEPLVPGMKFAKYGNVDSLKAAIDGDVGAVIVEPVQGEAGVIIPDEGYLKEVRELTEKKDVLLILDEVQTGFGRTGKMFAYEHQGIKPDILCLAKGLGGGFPIGAAVYDCGDFEPGEHGGTFIGNPLACTVARTVIETIKKENLVENSEMMGRYLLEKLKERDLSSRGTGLMIGIDVADGSKAVSQLVGKKVLTINSKNTVRVLPPLIIGRKHADEFLAALDSIEGFGK